MIWQNPTLKLSFLSNFQVVTTDLGGEATRFHAGPSDQTGMDDLSVAGRCALVVNTITTRL